MLDALLPKFPTPDPDPTHEKSSFNVSRNLHPDTTGTYETFQEKIQWHLLHLKLRCLRIRASLNQTIRLGSHLQERTAV